MTAIRLCVQTLGDLDRRVVIPGILTVTESGRYQQVLDSLHRVGAHRTLDDLNTALAGTGRAR